MRTTDPEPRPCIPVGEKVTPPTPSKPEPTQTPRGDYGIVTGPDGRLRTTKEPQR